MGAIYLQYTFVLYTAFATLSTTLSQQLNFQWLENADISLKGNILHNQRENGASAPSHAKDYFEL